MNKTRGIQFFGAALALALLAALAVWWMLKSTEPDRVGVVTAAVDISPGAALDLKMLTVEKWPANAVPRGAYRDPAEVAGRTAANGMSRGEAVIEKRLLSRSRTVQKATPVSSDGMVAVSLKVKAVAGVSGMLQRGDRVDVMASSDVANGKDARISRVILIGVTVLDVKHGGDDGKTPAGGFRGNMIVTLSLSREDARILAVADGEDLKLIARNPLDPSMEAGDVAVYNVRSGPRTTVRLRADAAEKDVALDGLLEKEKRAVTVSYAYDDGICGFLRPGNRVDILAVTSAGDVSVKGLKPGAEAEHLETETTARIILQNIPILVVEDDIEMKRISDGLVESGKQTDASNEMKPAKAEPVGRLTLLLSPSEAEKIILAYSSEAIQLKFVCRNASDDGVVATRGQTLVDAFWGDRKPFEVEIFRGSGKDGMAFDPEGPALSEFPDRSPLPRDPQPMGKELI